MTFKCSTMSVAHTFEKKIRTADVLITESVDFAGLLLSKNVLEGLLQAGFKKPSPIQLKAIPLGRCGLDLIVQAKSGTGKTCVFTVVALEGVDINFVGIQVLVLAPTREIAQQIQDVVKTIGKTLVGLKCKTFIGGLPLSLDKVSAKKCHIAVGTPGRVKQLIEIGAMDTTSIRLFVLDEADKLLEGDFQESINWIYSTLPENKQMLALSATYPDYLAQHLTAYMRNPTFVRLNATDPALLGIKQFYVSVPSHPMPNVIFNSKTLAVVKLISNINFQQCLIFSNMQTRAKNLQSELQSRNWPTACIAGCLDQKERTFAMDQLKTYKCRILISTDLTSRGIDADKVNLVINMDIPSDHETYLHRIGRAGRFGSHGAAVTIITSDGEINEMKDIEIKCNTTIKELPEPIPRDLIIKPEVVSLDDVVTSEQIINKPEIIQNEIEKKDVSLLHTNQHSDPPTHVLKDELFVCDNIVTDALSLTRVIVHENNSEKFSKTDCEADISTCAKENYFLNEVELPEPKTVNNEQTEKQVFQVEREQIIHEMSDKNILEKEWLKTDRTVSSISSDELLKKMSNNSDVIITSEFNDAILLSDISEDRTIEEENYLHEEKHSEASLRSVPELHEDKVNVLNTGHSELKGRLTENDLPSGSDSNSPSYAPQREIARSRQRRRAPRSLAVCDFLHYVKDDFVGVKDTGAGGDNLEGKCFTTIAPDVDNSHSAANLKSKDEDQSQQYESETSGQSGNIKHDCHGVKSMKILEPGQLGSAASNVYSSDRKQPCSQDDVKELGINEDSVVCDGNLTDCQFKNDEAVVMNLKLATHTVCNSHQDGIIQSGTSCILSNGTEFGTTSTHFMNHISASQTAESIPENGHISPLSSNSGKNLSDVLSNVASVPDLNSITRALSFLLTQTEKIIQPVSFTKLVGDHTDFCDQFDKTSSKDPESTHLSESLELKDVINWQVVCETNSMKLDHFKSNINDRLQFLEMERLLNKERMADRDSGDKKFKCRLERNSTKKYSSIVEINDAKDSEKTSTKQVKKTGKSKKKKKSPKPSDNLDWRSAQLDNVEQRNGKEFLTNQINTDNGYQVPEENHRVGLTLYLTPVQKSKVEFQTSCENIEKFNSLTRHLESESSNTEERVSRHQKSRSKDDECQALDDMHDLMLKRRQERKRLRQQSSESASAILIQDNRLDSANCTFQVKNDPIGEPQNDSNLKSAGVCRTTGLVPHKIDAESSIISVLSDKDNVDKHAADSKKDSGSLWKKKDIIVGIDKKVKKSASVTNTKVKLETAVGDHSQRLQSEDSLHENKKLADRNPDRNSECMVTNVGKYKPRKPSKTRARLAGLEISDGSTSSSHLSLSSTSDISDVLSDVDSEHQILKFQCYANRYADDERCMLYDSTRSDGYPLHVAHGLCKHQNTESSPYSTDEAYHRNFCISSYSPYVPSCLPASAVHLQLPSSKIEHSVGNEYSKVIHKSKQDPSHLKNNKLSRCLHRNVTGGMKLKNDKKASHDSLHHHPNSTFAKKGKSGSFEQYPSSENDSDSDHPSESKCSSNQSFSEYHQYYHHHPSPAFIPVTSCNRFMHPHPPPSSYFTYQQQMASPYFFPHPLQYFPQNLTYWSHQWYLQYQYINCMTKAYTYYFEK